MYTEYWKPGVPPEAVTLIDPIGSPSQFVCGNILYFPVKANLKKLKF